jgi:cysteinyl-tRNA synthetase
LKLYNTLSKNLEEFTPIDPSNVRMYVCGPTVYDRPHLGNARSVVVYDVLYRLLVKLYGMDNVTYARNITDVDDKINARALELGVSIQELTSKTHKEFTSDMEYLGCQRPNHEPKATEHIQQIIEIAEKLIGNGNAYVSNDHVYFDVTSFDEYGELSGRNLDDMLEGVRIDVSENKKHPGDFVLWKPASKKDDKSSVFESPWGPGRPGWHIECSAMSKNFLGEDFDIHGGGADLVFPHHTNEIAQSRCAHKGSKYARFWVHNGFLTVGGEKMSKSLGNFTNLGHFIDQNIKGEIVRFMLLSSHYRKPLDYNEKALYDATETMDYFYRALSNLDNGKVESSEEFISHLKDDLNISESVVYMRELAKNIHKSDSDADKQKYASMLKACGNLIGILEEDSSAWFKSGKKIDEAYILDMIEKRDQAKAAKDFARADQIRDELKSKGIGLEDKPDGSVGWR